MSTRTPLTTWRGPVGVLGELLLTVGVLLGLFVVYELWWTGLHSERTQSRAQTQLERTWADGTPSSTNPRGRGVVPEEGEAFARLYIPAFGADYRFAVVAGTSPDALEGGPGHYTGTQGPGEPGNFAVAGHRVGRGAPFNDLDALRACDALVYATADRWLIYRVLPVDVPDRSTALEQASRCLPRETAERVTSGGYAGLSGLSVVRPEEVGVIAPVPGGTAPASQDLLPLATLTTCHPQFSASERLVVHAVLERSEPRVPGRVPAELGG